MARLAKYWNSTIICTESLFGRSYTFKLLGIKAGRDEEEFRNKIGQKPSVSRAFRQFLKMVEDIGQQQIVFTYSEDFYSRSDTPDDILQQKPLILDPSNPYLNVMSDFHGRDSVQQLFSDCAKETLKRLENAERQAEMGSDSLNLKEIFLPQTRPPRRPMNVPQMWSVEAKSGQTSLEPKLLVRNKMKVKEFQKAFSAFIFASDIEAKYENPSDKTVFAKESIQKGIDYLLGRERGTIDKSTPDTHENHDLAFEIPIGREEGETLVISAKWNLI